MTSIIELARQAGLELNWFDDNFPVLHGKLITLEQLIRADEREQNAANLDDFTPDECLLQSAWLCLDELGSQLMHDGVPVDPEHPKRQAMTHCYALVSEIAKRLEKA